MTRSKSWSEKNKYINHSSLGAISQDAPFPKVIMS